MSPLRWRGKTVIISMVKKSAPTLKELRNDGIGPVLRFFRVIFVKNLTKRDRLRYFVSFVSAPEQRVQAGGNPARYSVVSK